MSANPCRDFFSLHAENRNVVKELQGTTDPIAWEKLSASDHSPGVVDALEVVYRQVMHPIHVDSETNKLKPTAFDDASDKGLSVERVAHKSLAEILQTGEERAAEQRARGGTYSERKLFAVAELHVGDIRAIVDAGGQRGLTVYDTALCANSAHGDICQILSNRQSGRSVRSKLIDAVRSLKSD